MAYTLKDCLKSADDVNIVILLEHWGTWCKCDAMPKGLKRSRHHSYSITDDDGIAIDQALAKLKAISLFHYECIRCEYVFHLGVKATKLHLIELLNKIGNTELAQLLQRNFNRILFEQALSSAEKKLIELIRESHTPDKAHSLQSLDKAK